jgi:transcriptional regulator with XRE-family HTH domain
MSLGKTIARLRKKSGLTQAELATKMEVHQSLVTRWERDIVQPRSKTLEKIAEILQVSAQEILAGDFGGVTTTLSEVNDTELISLFGRVHQLSTDERSALKLFLQALFTRIDMQEMIMRRPQSMAS